MAPTPSSRRARTGGPDRSWSGHVILSLDGLEAVLQPIAGAVDGDYFAVVEESVEDRGGEDLVAEHLAPLTNGLVHPYAAMHVHVYADITPPPPPPSVRQVTG